jgi:hypothetical protein
MAAEFIEGALRLFSLGDAAGGDVEADREVPPSLPSPSSPVAAPSAERPLSLRAMHPIRSSVRAEGLAWYDEAGGGDGSGSPRTVGAGSGRPDVLPPGSVSARRLAEFTRVLEARSVNTEALRKLAWFGSPARYRSTVWQILLGHLPASADRATDSLARKRTEYESFVTALSSRSSLGGGSKSSDGEQRMLRQVLVDCPRTCPSIPLYHTAWVQRSLARVLTAYAARHFATGYVQGINDLACPLYAVFLSPWADLESGDGVLDAIPAEELAEVESDVYWCLTRTLEGIQSHYLASQPGVHTMMAALRDLCFRIDGACTPTRAALVPPPSLTRPPTPPPQSASWCTWKATTWSSRPSPSGG